MLNVNLDAESVLRAGAAAGCALAAAAAGLTASLPLALPFSLGPAGWVAPGLICPVGYATFWSMRRHLAGGCNILTALHLKHTASILTWGCLPSARARSLAVNTRYCGRG